MKNKTLRFLACILCFAICLSGMMLGTGVVSSAAPIENGEQEPVYDPYTNRKYEITGLKPNDVNATYENGVLTVPTKSDGRLVTNLPDDASFYVSMQVKSAGAFNFLFREGLNYMNISKTNYRVPSAQPEWVNENFANLQSSDGIRITIYSTTTSVKVWVNGEQYLDADLYEDYKNKKPFIGIGWPTGSSATAWDIVVWTDETPAPIYNPATDKLYQPTSTVASSDGVYTVPASTNCYFTAVNEVIPNEFSYSMVLKSSSTVNIDFNSHAMYLFIRNGQYALISGDGQYINNTALTLANGVKITFVVTASNVEVWAGDIKIVDYDADFSASTAKPGISWSNNGEVTVSDVKIWSAKTNEPQYTDGKIYDFTVSGDGASYADGVLSLAGEKTAVLDTALVEKADYYMSMVIKSEKSVNVVYTTDDGYFHFEPNGYWSSIGTDGSSGTDTDLKNLLKSGVKVTVHFTRSGNVGVWVGGKQIVNSAYSKSGVASPRFYAFAGTGATVSDIKIWTDEPMYEPSKDSRYFPTSFGNAVVGEDGVITVPDQSGAETTYSNFTTTLASDADYYMTMKISAESLSGYSIVNVRYYQNAYIQLQTNNFTSPATNSGVYTNWSDVGLSNSILKNGIDLQIKCSFDEVTIWANGIKIVDGPTTNAGVVMPGISWMNNGTTAKISDLKIWTKGNLGDCDGDNTISSADMVLMQKFLLSANGNNVQFADADITVDGNVNILDLIRFKNYFLGKSSLG